MLLQTEKSETEEYLWFVLLYASFWCTWIVYALISHIPANHTLYTPSDIPIVVCPIVIVCYFFWVYLVEPDLAAMTKEFSRPTFPYRDF